MNVAKLEIRARKALEQRARRVPKTVGLVATKSRKHPGSVDNEGGFMLVGPLLNCVEAGHRFDFSAEDVINYCTKD